MSRFTIRTADLTVNIDSIFASTEDYCREYIVPETAGLSVKVEPGDIAFERIRSARERELEHLPKRDYPDAYLEILAVYRKIAEKAPFYDTMLFHCSAVAVDGEAYLFTAASGTGKSTHVRLWRQLFGDRAVVINDDKPLIRIGEERAVVCGTPWNGKHRSGSNTSAPIKAICLLERGTVNQIRPADAKELYPLLLQQTYRPADPAALIRTMELLDALTERVRFYRLSCNMDPEAARVAYQGMN